MSLLKQNQLSKNLGIGALMMVYLDSTSVVVNINVTKENMSKVSPFSDE